MRQRTRIIFGLRNQPPDMSRSFGDDQSELGQMTTQSVDNLSALPDQKISGSKNNCRSLGCFAPYLHEAHRRPLRRLADRLRVRCVVLLPLHKGLYIGWWNKQNFVTQAGKLAAPIMRRRASFHRNSARRLSCKELQDSSPAQSLSKHDCAGGITSF